MERLWTMMMWALKDQLFFLRFYPEMKQNSSIDFNVRSAHKVGVGNHITSNTTK